MHELLLLHLQKHYNNNTITNFAKFINQTTNKHYLLSLHKNVHVCTILKLLHWKMYMSASSSNVQNHQSIELDSDILSLM